MATRMIRITGSGNSRNLYFVVWKASGSEYYYTPETIAINDGTSVSAYAAGSRSITLNGVQVAYGGYYDFTVSKDLTINITSDGISITDGAIQAGLPSEYKRAEYIQSSGTEYIDTGFIPTSNTQVVMDFQLVVAGSGNRCLFGTVDSDNYQFSFRWFGSNSYFRSNGYENRNFPTSVNATARHTVVKSGTSCTIDNTYTVTHTAESMDKSLYLLAHRSDSGATDFASAKIYSCKIYDSGILVRDYIPCENTSGTAGLYDTVNGIFYTNVGSGSFIVGKLSTTQKTLIDGTCYEITEGKILVGGTNYDIKKGRTLIAGTGYDIWLKLLMLYINYAELSALSGSTISVMVNGNEYTNDTTPFTTTLTVEEGTEVTINTNSTKHTVFHVYLNGSLMQSGDDMSYIFEITSNTSIHIYESTASSDTDTHVYIEITIDQ